MLSFQKLDVYRCAVQFLALTAEVSAEVPRGNAALLDQLRRAANGASPSSANAVRSPDRKNAATVARDIAL